MGRPGLAQVTPLILRSVVLQSHLRYSVTCYISSCRPLTIPPLAIYFRALRTSSGDADIKSAKSRVGPLFRFPRLEPQASTADRRHFPVRQSALIPTPFPTLSSLQPVFGAFTDLGPQFNRTLVIWILYRVNGSSAIGALSRDALSSLSA